MRAMRLALIAAGVVCTIATAGLAGAQSFQGAVRGLVKDSGGLVPGAEVVLTNDSTTVARSTTSNAAGEYNFPNLPPGIYTLKVALQGYKGYSLAERPSRHAAVPHAWTWCWRSGARGNHHGPRRPADHRDVDGLHRHGPRHAGPADAAVARPRRVPDRHDGADRHPVRRHPVQPPAGSDQRLADLARRRHAARQQLHPRRRADHRPAQPRQRQPDDRVARRRQGAGAHLRRGDGPHRWRRVQHDAAIRRQRLRGTGFFQTRPGWGQTNNYFSEKAGLPKPDSPYYLGGGGVGGPIVRNRTFFWFASENYHDVQTRNASVTMPTARERRGDFSQSTNAAGQLGRSSTTR